MITPQVDWLARWAGYHPGRRVLRDHARDSSWTYAQAQARAVAVADHLRHDLGVRRGERVAVLAQNRAETVFLFFACVKLGAVLVPLNFRLTAHELADLLSNCEPRVLFVGDDEQAITADLPPAATASCEQLPLSQITPLITGATDPDPEVTEQLGALDDAVMILYTSGSTGTPKGVVINHRMMLWNAINTSLRLELRGSDHTLGFAPLFHTGGWHVLLTPFLHHGAATTLLDRFEPDAIIDLMERERVTILFGVPTMLQMLAERPRFATADLDSCRFAVVGGAPMPLALIDTWHDKGIPIRQGYGLTEVGPNCFSLHQDHAKRKRGSIGQPNFYLEARVVDEDGRDCPPGQPGELWLRGETVTPGYWRQAEQTAAAITDGWFRTGDVVMRDREGFFFVVDRKKHMFISGGENVYPAEVERALTTHPCVRQAAVIGVPDARWGEVGHAFLVADGSPPVDATSLRRFCLDRLAKYKIPKCVTILPALPLNQTGKVDRIQLQSLI